MKLSIHQLVSTYLVLQVTALPTEIDPIDIDLENMEPVTIDPMNLGATTVSVVDHHAPSTILVAPVAEATQSATAVETPAAGETLTIPDIDIPLGNPYAGKPAWECWYEKNLARNTYHMTAINWNATESDIHDTCKKSDALTFWNWEEHINSAGAQTILVGFTLPLYTCNRFEKNMNKYLKRFHGKYPDLDKFKCPSQKPKDWEESGIPGIRPPMEE